MSRRTRDRIGAALQARRAYLLRLLRQHRLPEHAHEDAAQEVMLYAYRRALRGRLDWQSRWAIDAFFRKVARSYVIDWWEQNRPPPRDRREHPSDIDAVVAARELLRLLEASTNPLHWEVIILHATERSIPIVAMRLKIPTGTAYTRLWLGRRALLRALRIEAMIDAGWRRAKPVRSKK